MCHYQTADEVKACGDIRRRITPGSRVRPLAQPDRCESTESRSLRSVDHRTDTRAGGVWKARPPADGRCNGVPASNRAEALEAAMSGNHLIEDPPATALRQGRADDRDGGDEHEHTRLHGRHANAADVADTSVPAGRRTRKTHVSATLPRGPPPMARADVASQPGRSCTPTPECDTSSRAIWCPRMIWGSLPVARRNRERLPPGCPYQEVIFPWQTT